jgi:ABC-type sugar transport system ATPase subunit
MSDVILQSKGIRLGPATPAINIALHRGEIVGIAGLDGHGQEAFLEILCGLRKPAAGETTVYSSDGQPHTLRSFHHAVRSGVIYLPRNRKTQGILPTLSVLDNFSIATLSRFSRLGIVSRKANQRRLREFQEKLSIVYASPRISITSLSGGNQQKVLLARWMASAPKAMLLNDPTRGVDLRTRMKLYEVFREMAAKERTALVVLSTEIEEVLELCDRVLIFRDQHVFAELDRSQMTMSSIIQAMFGDFQHESE